MSSISLRPEAPGARLRAFAESLGLPLMGESSVKISSAGIFPNRFLLSVPADLSEIQLEILGELTAELGLPPERFATVAADLRLAVSLHFGFETGASGDVLKLYCEFPLSRGWDLARRAGHPLLVHRAVKWDPADPGQAATSRYTARPALGIADTAARIRELLGENPAAPLAVGLLNRAAGRIGARDRLFLEVEEEGTMRRSFDLKLYDARFTTADLGPALPGLSAFFGLPPIELPAAPLGHVAGGQGRDGKPFLTFYYGGGRA